MFQSKKARKVFEELLFGVLCFDKKKNEKPGYLISKLSKEDREALKDLKPTDINDRIK